MKDFEFNGKKHLLTATKKFNVEQYEAAQPYIMQYLEFAQEVNAKVNKEKGLNDEEKAENNLDVFRAVSQLKITIPIIAFLYVEEGRIFDSDYFERKIKELKGLPIDIIRGVRSEVLDFLNGGAKFITEYSLFFSPVEAAAQDTLPLQT